MNNGVQSVESRRAIPRPRNQRELDDLKQSLHIRHEMRKRFNAELLTAKNKEGRHMAHSKLTQNNLFLRAIARAIYEWHNPES